MSQGTAKGAEGTRDAAGREEQAVCGKQARREGQAGCEKQGARPARSVDLNCDLGESFGAWKMGRDEEVLPLVTSVNVACGMHAGDPLTMRATIELARAHQVSVGAHPGYPDLQGFGRRALALSPREAYAYVQYQVAALEGMCRAQGVRLAHVKPHGALYNTCARDEALADAVAAAVRDLDPGLALVALAGSVAAERGRAAGLRVAEEFFADRGYTAQGALVPRGQDGAMVSDARIAAARVMRAVEQGEVEAVDGTVVPVRCDTVCIHGDGAQALAFAHDVRAALLDAGFELRAPATDAGR